LHPQFSGRNLYFLWVDQWFKYEHVTYSYMADEASKNLTTLSKGQNQTEIHMAGLVYICFVPCSVLLVWDEFVGHCHDICYHACIRVPVEFEDAQQGTSGEPATLNDVKA
jgi:hypothetical protein